MRNGEACGSESAPRDPLPEDVFDLLKNGSIDEAMTRWEVFVRDQDREGPVIMNARLDLIPRLIYKTEFYWADQEIQQVPQEFDELVPLLGNWRSRIGTSKEVVINGHQSIPERLWRPNWWKKGPVLLPDKAENVRLSKWFSARINDDDKKRFYASGLEIHPRRGARPGVLAIHKDHAKKWAEGADLIVNDFIELGSYITGEDEKVIIKIHEPAPDYAAHELWPPDFTWPAEDDDLQIKAYTVR